MPHQGSVELKLRSETEVVPFIPVTCRSSAPIHYRQIRVSREIASISPWALWTEQVKIEPNWINPALHELNQVREEAAEEGIQPPSLRTIALARRAIRHIDMDDLPEPSVYPTEDRGVAIFFASENPGAGVLLVCEPGGSGICISSIEGKSIRMRFEDGTDMFGVPVLNELQRLANWSLDVGDTTAT